MGDKLHEAFGGTVQSTDPLEKGETVEDSEPAAIEKSGDEWLEETVEGFADTFFERGTEEHKEAKRRLRKKLAPKKEEWENNTWEGVKDFVDQLKR